MKNNKSLLYADTINITEKFQIRIPTVGEILEDEQAYYNIISALTATPYQYMVLLADNGLDYTEMTDYDLFTMLFPSLCRSDLSILFGDLNTADYNLCYDPYNATKILYSPANGTDYKIDEFVYAQLSGLLRRINNIEKNNARPGNEEAKRYLLEKERKRLRRNAGRPYEPHLEKQVIALVNRPEFKYNYEEVMNLSIYTFQQSLKQVQTSITFDNTMIGVYAGTIDTSKIKDRSCFSWIPVS